MNAVYLYRFRRMAKKRYRIRPMMGDYCSYYIQRYNGDIKQWEYMTGFFDKDGRCLYDAKIRVDDLRRNYIMDLVKEEREKRLFHEMCKRAREYEKG